MTVSSVEEKPRNQRISMIVAMDANRVIGVDGTMPWHLPSDLRWFKRVTLGKPVIMGRKTHESIGKPLPGRRNLILSRSDYKSEGTETVAHPDEVMNRCESDDELMIIGGGEIYRLFMPMADRLFITHVETVIPNGQTTFPVVDSDQWQEVASEYHRRDESNPFDHCFTILDRIQANPT